MVIEVAKIGMKMGTLIGVEETIRSIMPRLIPESANVATKVCYGLAGAGVGGAICSASNDYFDKRFTDFEEMKVVMKSTPLIKEILKKESEEIVKAETEEEIVAIIERADKEVNAVREKIREDHKKEKIEKAKAKERKRNLGKLYKAANKKLKTIKTEDRK